MSFGGGQPQGIPMQAHLLGQQDQQVLAQMQQRMQMSLMLMGQLAMADFTTSFQLAVEQARTEANKIGEEFDPSKLKFSTHPRFIAALATSYVDELLVLHGFAKKKEEDAD